MAKGVEYSMGEGGETLADPMETPNTLNWCWRQLVRLAYPKRAPLSKVL